MARTKATQSPASPLNAKKASASEVLDELLPMAEPSAPEFHMDAAVLAGRRPGATPGAGGRHGAAAVPLCRLAPDVALVDPGTRRRAGRGPAPSRLYPQDSQIVSRR